MIKFFKRLWKGLVNFLKKLQPGDVAWTGAAKAIGTTTILIWIIAGAMFLIIQPGTWFGIWGVLSGVVLAGLVSAGTMLGLWLINLLPKKFLWVIPGTIFVTGFVFSLGALSWKFPLFVILFAGGAGAGLYSLKKKNRGELTLLQRIVAIGGSLVGLAGLIWGLIWLSDTGFEPETPPINAAMHADYRPAHISLSNPGVPGPYKVNYLTYGSGKDKHRPEYGEDVTITTDSVDGSRLIDNWEGMAGKLRTRYWGVDEESLPINGRVWYPEGDGPFPLALIVHGNHGMHDYSDPGYEYLGQLLASQGIILTSVDENFINSGWTDILGSGLDEENDARGWLLLKHLQSWRSWNKTEGHQFFGKIDMDNLAVMGHSRGGEAAAIAGFFNRLPYYPDNALETFDFDFNIQAVVSIAPVDGQYRPGEVGTPLENVNYLVLHGANDGDVQSFGGLRQYERLKFTDSTYYFKSALYIYGANHGQFNTSWGNKDSPQPFASLLNLDALMPMEEQLTIGKVYISAFLQATLQGKKEYETLFQDHRSGIDWLPNTIYLNQYQNSDWHPLATFEEDLDLTTTSAGDSISTKNLTVWREQRVGMKWGNKATRAAYIGWDSLAYEGDTARYALHFKNPIDASETPTLSFELSEARGSTYPEKDRDEKKKEAEKEESNSEEEEEAEDDPTVDEDEEKEEYEDEEKKAPDPIDFSIVITDAQNTSATFKLSDYSYLQRQLKVDVYKNPELQSAKTSEAVYNTFFIDLNRLTEINPDIDLTQLARLEFVFDQTKQAVIILDKLSIH